MDQENGPLMCKIEHANTLFLSKTKIHEWIKFLYED